MELRAEDFGASNNTVALRRMLDVANAHQGPVHLHWPGEYRLSAPIEIGGDHWTHSPGTFTATESMPRMLTIRGRHQQFRGKIGLRGTGGLVYNQRTVTDGVVIEDAQHTQFAGFRLENFRRFGLYLDTDHNHTGIQFGHIFVDNCGSASEIALARVAFPFTSRADLGFPSDPGQFTRLGCVPPADLRVGDLVKFDLPYLVTSVGADHIDIHPWLIDDQVSSGTLVSMHGGGVCLGGANTAWQRIDGVSGFHFGELLSMRGLYGASVGFVGGQAGSLVVRLGPSANGTSQGFFASGIYAEGTPYDIVKVSRTIRRAVLGGFATYDRDRMVAIGPTTDDRDTVHGDFDGVAILGVQNPPTGAL